MGSAEPIPVEEHTAKVASEKAGAKKRVLKAEAHLRAAIAAVTFQRKHIASHGTLFSGRHPLCTHGHPCVANSIGSLCQSFVLAYGVRAGIGVLMRAFKLSRKRPYLSFLDLKLLLAENNLVVREEACRTGLLFGCFTGGFHALRCFLRRTTNKETPMNVVLAGSIAGLSILALDDAQQRRTLALYLAARLAQCAYNSAKAKDQFHFSGSHWQYGNTLLFSLACAQIIYAYILRPETLPKAYLGFLMKTGRISKQTLKAVRESIRGPEIDVESLSKWVVSKAGKPLVGVHKFSPIIPCSAIHPDMPSCLDHNARLLRVTFKTTFPFYLSLTFVPFLVLNMQKFLHAPIYTFWTAVKGAVRSTTFLSTFVVGLQIFFCVQRKVMSKDHKSIYFIGGALAGLAVLLENEKKRSELALYMLPRAADSLWHTLVKRNLLPDISYAEVALCCLCMGGVMYYHEYEPTTMAPFLRGLTSRFLNKAGTPDQMNHFDPKLERPQILVNGEELQGHLDSPPVNGDGSESSSPTTAAVNGPSSQAQPPEEEHAEAVKAP